MNSEANRVKTLENWYVNRQLDFDKRLIRFRYESLKPYFVGNSCLELGPAEGEMTKYLVEDFASITVVEGSKRLLDLMPEYQNVQKVHSLFEDFTPSKLYDTIILEHILEHVEDPVELINRVKDFLAPNGTLLLGVPNGDSFHRLVAVEMGLLDHQCQLNSRDISLGHRRVYTPTTFRSDIERTGLKISKLGGVFFKPLSNKQIQENWDNEMIQGFFELGKLFGDNAAEIYAVCNCHE